MFKKFAPLLVLLLLVGLVACGSDNTSSDNGRGDNKGPIPAEELEKMYGDPKKYKGREVEFYARVFVEPERDSDGVYLQVFMNNNDERNVIVGIDDPDLDVATDDSLKIKGTVEDVMEGENALGGKVTAPVIKASSIEKVSYAEAFAPAKKTIEVNETQKQHGYELTLEKVEIADKETRLYVKVNNNSKHSISFYGWDTKLVIGNKQLESEDNYEANYPEVQSEILAGVESSGIVMFPKVEENAEMIKWIAEGSSDNYNIDLKPFTFEIEIK